jgi:cell division protein FtsL
MRNLKEILTKISPEEKILYATLAISFLGMLGSAVYSIVTGRTVNMPIPIIRW